MRCSASVRLLLGLLWRPCEAEWQRGSVMAAANSTTFLGKFCFGFNKSEVAGKVAAKLHIRSSGSAVLLLFDDQAESYPGSTKEWQAFTCDEKQERARSAWQISPDEHSNWEWSTDINEGIRPRWWYAAVAECDGTGEIALDYELHWENPLQHWQSEFSVERCGALKFSVFLVFAYAFLAFMQSRANAIRHRLAGLDGDELHPVVRILTKGLGASTVAMLCLALNFWYFEHFGTGLWKIYVLGQLIHAFSRFMLMSILCLVARGRFVSFAVDSDDVRWLFALLGPLQLLRVSLELWGECAESRKYTTNFVYTSHFGLALVLADVGLFVLYVRSLLETVARERDAAKVRFYGIWGITSSVWFVTLPIAFFLSLLLSPWVRFRVLLYMSQGAQLAASAALVCTFWPGEGEHSTATPCLTLNDEDLMSFGKPVFSHGVRGGAPEEWVHLDG